MSTSAKRWVPIEALHRPALLSRLDRAISEWAELWFVDYRPRIEAVTPEIESVTSKIAQSLGVAAEPFGLAPRDKRSLLSRAIDIDLAQLELTDEDQRVLGALEDQIVKAFHAALKSVVTSLDEASKPGVGVTLVLGDGSGALPLKVRIPRDAMTSAALATLPSPPEGRGGLTSFSDAMADVPVAVKAWLGSAQLALPEARRLTKGDVLVLDRSLDAPLDLCVGDGKAPVAHARILEAASPARLQLEPLNSQLAS